MANTPQPTGCLMAGINVIGAILGALLKAFLLVMAFLYNVLFAGFQYKTIANKSGFVLFWMTAVFFGFTGASIMASNRTLTSSVNITPIVITVVVTRLAQIEVTPKSTTATPVPATHTPRPTATAMPTATQTQTATATPGAETATAAAQQTAESLATADKAGSQTAVAAVSTATAKSIGATQTRSALHATQTREAKAATATYLAEFVDIDYRELRDYADQHSGEKVCFRGRVFNIVSGNELQMYFAGTYDGIYVEFERDFTGIYEDNTIRVCGIVLGEIEFQNAIGATVSSPAIWFAFVQ